MPGEFELLDLLGSWDVSESVLSLLNSKYKSLPSRYKIQLQTLRNHSNTRNVSEKARVNQFLKKLPLFI